MVTIGQSLSELCLMTPPANQNGCLNRTQFNIRPCGKLIKKYSFLEQLAEFESTLSGGSLDESLIELYLMTPLVNQSGCLSRT